MSCFGLVRICLGRACSTVLWPGHDVCVSGEATGACLCHLLGGEASVDAVRATPDVPVPSAVRPAVFTAVSETTRVACALGSRSTQPCARGSRLDSPGLCLCTWQQTFCARGSRTGICGEAVGGSFSTAVQCLKVRSL